ncbi:MAG: sulfite exporter TauE/SafE family protein [Candidatus Omnitrophica bacterium]|nr:sulfite exporter TauE/SafE family protein [Candidatus Omnitrophota bacterium]
MSVILLYLIIGILAGIFGGFFGLGGGIVAVPALVYLFGMSQHQAQGTVLTAFLPPIGILAFLEYYKNGFVNFKIAIFIALGIFIGSFFGAFISVHTSTLILKRLFGVLLLVVSIRLILIK